MADRCPTCGGAVASIFEHVDINCRPIADAPHDGSTILGLYQADDRFAIHWEEYRSHPAGDGSMGPGWVGDETGYPEDEPQAWAKVEDE